MNGAKKIYTEILPRTKHTILTRPGIGWLKELDSGNKVIDLVTRNMQLETNFKDRTIEATDTMTKKDGDIMCLISYELRRLPFKFVELFRETL